jgi:hypothetical protein
VSESITDFAAGCLAGSVVQNRKGDQKKDRNGKEIWESIEEVHRSPPLDSTSFWMPGTAR